jgi:hypothetical protein
MESGCDPAAKQSVNVGGLRPDELFLTAIHTYNGPTPALAPDQARSANFRHTLRMLFQQYEQR